MKKTIEELSEAFKESQKRMPELHRAVTKRMSQFLEIHEKWKKLDVTQREAIQELQIAASQADIKICQEKMKAIDRIENDKAKLEEQIASIDDSANDVVAPFVEILNYAIALEPTVQILRGHFMEIPRPIRDQIQKESRLLTW